MTTTVSECVYDRQQEVIERTQTLQKDRAGSDIALLLFRSVKVGNFNVLLTSNIHTYETDINT